MWVKVRVTCFSHLVGSGHLSILVFSDLPSKAQIDLPKGIFKILSLSVRASDFHLVRSSFYVFNKVLVFFLSILLIFCLNYSHISHSLHLKKLNLLIMPGV